MRQIIQIITVTPYNHSGKDFLPVAKVIFLENKERVAEYLVKFSWDKATGCPLLSLEAGESVIGTMPFNINPLASMRILRKCAKMLLEEENIKNWLISKGLVVK